MWWSSFGNLLTLPTDWLVLTITPVLIFLAFFLKVGKARVELLTVRKHLEMAQNLIRRDVSSVLSKRLATMSNQYLEGFDRQKREHMVSWVQTTFMVELCKHFHFLWAFLRLWMLNLAQFFRLQTTPQLVSIGSRFGVSWCPPQHAQRLSSGSNDRENSSQYVVRVSDGSIGSSRQETCYHIEAWTDVICGENLHRSLHYHEALRGSRPQSY